MKYDEFIALCVREWENDNGDVRDLWLTEDSYRELSDSSLLHGAQELATLYIPVTEESPSEMRQGVDVKFLVHPVTRSVVKMHIARDMDVADVFYSGGGFQSRILDPDRARELGVQIS